MCLIRCIYKKTVQKFCIFDLIKIKNNIHFDINNVFVIFLFYKKIYKNFVISNNEKLLLY